MVVKNNFGSIGMALSCTLFLEGALNKYKKYTVSVNDDTVLLIKEWNNVLISLLIDPRYKTMLGNIGNKLIKFKSKCQDYAARCVDDAPDVNVQSLHYALRFQENIKFLNRKIKENERLSFVDFGCGLSPLSIVMQNEYSLVNTYCIDIVPEIADLYTNASYQLIGKIPEFIDWEYAKSENNDINTIVSVGCLPHMPLNVQKEYLKTINKKFENFFLEIKYKKQDGIANSENAFSLMDLQKLRIDVDNVTDIETAMIKNSLIYLSKFVHAKPERKDFLINQSRSLFLSR